MISFMEGNQKFNFRTAAIIYNPERNKILIHRKRMHGFWLLPGGRVEFQEDAGNGVKRELKEELDVTVIDQKLKIVSESFFELFDTIYHELAFYYEVTIDVDNCFYVKDGEFTSVEGDEDIFMWFDIEKLRDIDIRPPFLLNVLNSKDQGIIHIIENSI